MQFDQSLRQRQTEAYPVMFPGEAVADLAERRQRYRYLVGRHADAGIFDAERNAPVNTLLDRESHLAAGRGELDRVGQQIDEDLGQLGGIADHRRQVLVDLADELDLRSVGHVLHDLRAKLDNVADFDLFFRQQEPVGIGLAGGHLFFFAAEGLFRRPVGLRVREVAQQVGLVLLVSLMLFAVYNDIYRWIQG